jgi:Arc/MetJ-type ribon-helix-helix transcriptional regulator
MERKITTTMEKKYVTKNGLIRTNFHLSEYHHKKINELIEKRVFSSKAEAFREACRELVHKYRYILEEKEEMVDIK